MRLACLIFFAAISHAIAGPCSHDALNKFGTDQMTSDQTLRAKGYELLQSCYSIMRGSVLNEQNLDFIATLSGRLAVASYGADEEPQTSGVVASLLLTNFDQFYYYIRKQPESENSALMRALMLSMDNTTTGTIKRIK